MPDHDEIQPEPDRTDQGAAEQGGVFGNLPGTRPAVRSPRRSREKTGAGEAAGTQSHPAAQPKPGARPSPRGRPSERRHAPVAAESETPPDARAEHGGVEDLAWAGIAVAAEAATLGVRLLSRAVGAVRKPPDRR
jgi:hypothetical protein